MLSTLSSAPIKEGTLRGAFFVSRSDCRPVADAAGDIPPLHRRGKHAFHPLLGTN
jgi:hypothetical protein